MKRLDGVEFLEGWKNILKIQLARNESPTEIVGASSIALVTVLAGILIELQTLVEHTTKNTDSGTGESEDFSFDPSFLDD
jgi:hypothetical protein